MAPAAPPQSPTYIPQAALDAQLQTIGAYVLESDRLRRERSKLMLKFVIVVILGTSALNSAAFATLISAIDEFDEEESEFKREDILTMFAGCAMISLAYTCWVVTQERYWHLWILCALRLVSMVVILLWSIIYFALVPENRLVTAAYQIVFGAVNGIFFYSIFRLIELIEH